MAEIEARLEALKLAYDLAHKVGHFSSELEYRNGRADIHEDVDQVLKIADMNLEYLLNKEDRECLYS